MDTQIIPVQESEMRSFFDKVATQFVSLSDQARELTQVKSHLASIEQRLTDLTDENAKLKRELADIYEMATKFENESKQAKAENESLKSENSRLETENKELHGTVDHLRQQIFQVSNELTSLRQQHEQVNADLSHNKSRADRAEHERDTVQAESVRWKDHYYDLQGRHSQVSTENAKLRQSLEQVRSVLKSLEPTPDQFQKPEQEQKAAE